MEPCRVSFVVPIYKSHETIETLCAEIETALKDLKQYDLEIILVDDCSPDDAWTVVRRLAYTSPHVRGLRLKRNCGQHAAVLCGLARASGDILVVLDCDLQDPPAAVPKLIEGLADVDVVFAGRVNTYQSRGRMFSSKTYRALLLPLVGLPHGAGMFFAIRAGASVKLRQQQIRNPSVIGLIAGARLSAHELPVGRRMRRFGHSSYSNLGRLSSAMRMLWTFLRMRFRPEGQGAGVDNANWLANELIDEDTATGGHPRTPRD